MKRFLLHRTVVLVLLGLVAILLALGSLLAEKPFALDEEGFDHYLSPGGRLHLVTTHAAAVLVALCLVSLALACWDMLRTAWARTFHAAVPSEWRWIEGAEAPELARLARGAGFRLLAARGAPPRHVRHRWGHWANLLLHGGMALVLVAFQLYTATDHHGALTLVEGELAEQGAEPDAVSRGPLAPERSLPVGIRLDAVSWQVGRRGALEDQDAHLVLRDGARERARTVSPNASHYGWGYRVYQGAAGHAFAVDVARPEGVARHVLELPLPTRRDAAGYRDFALPDLPGVLRAKYRLPPASFPEGEAELTLRLVRDGAVAGQVSLRAGESGALAETTVQLAAVRRWSGLLVDSGRGMTVVFLGFCLVVLGAALLYATSPAELVAVPAADGRVRVGLRTFARCDRDREALDRLVGRLGRGEGAP